MQVVLLMDNRQLPTQCAQWAREVVKTASRVKGHLRVFCNAQNNHKWRIAE